MHATHALETNEVRGDRGAAVGNAATCAPSVSTPPSTRDGRVVWRSKVGLLIGAACAALGTVAACGSSAATPEASVVSAYEAANRGDYTQADTYVEPDIVGLADLGWDSTTRGGKLARIDLVSSDVEGSSATVVTSDHYTDGCVIQNDVTKLVLDHGQWLMTGGGSMSGENDQC